MYTGSRAGLDLWVCVDCNARVSGPRNTWGLLEREPVSLWPKSLANDDVATVLRIHEHTERGDNNSIKLAGKSLMNETPSGECCGGSASATPGTALR